RRSGPIRQVVAVAHLVPVRRSGPIRQVVAVAHLVPVRRSGPITHRDSQVAASAAQYVSTMSAPALVIEVSTSMTARSRSIQPRSAAASIIAYSPDTRYAATGTFDSSAAMPTTSR